MGTPGPHFTGKMGTRVPIFPGEWGPGSPSSWENGDLGSPFSQENEDPIGKMGTPSVADHFLGIQSQLSSRNHRLDDKVFQMKTSACRDGTFKNQANKMGTTPQHIYVIPISCVILLTMLCVC